MNIVTGEQNGVSVLSVSGNISQDDITELKSALLALVESAKIKIVLDLGGVNYLSSMAIAAFVTTHRRAKPHKGAVKIANASKLILKVLRATNLDNILEIHDSVDAAVRSF